MVQMAKFSFGEDWVPKKYGEFRGERERKRDREREREEEEE